MDPKSELDTPLRVRTFGNHVKSDSRSF